MVRPNVMTRFTGALSLNNAEGTIYLTHTQTGALTLSASNNARPGGWALVPITANGSAINVPSDWIQYGGDEISIVAGETNHFQIYWSGENYYWTNKVVPV